MQKLLNMKLLSMHAFEEQRCRKKKTNKWNQSTMELGKPELKKYVFSQNWCIFLENNDKDLENPQATTAAFIQSTLYISAIVQLYTIVFMQKVNLDLPQPLGKSWWQLLIQCKFVWWKQNLKKREAFFLGITTVCTSREF